MTEDFEVDDLLHRHGRAIAKALKPKPEPDPPSCLVQFIRWMLRRSEDEDDYLAKRFAMMFLALSLFVGWVMCDIAVDNWYNKEAYDERMRIEVKEHYWEFFKKLRESRNK
jgi:hypothetical protein